MWIAQREASPERTFGIYRVEVLAAMLNVIALWLIVAWIFFEAYHRFTLEGTQVDGGPVLIVGTGGLIVNIIALITELQAVAHDRYGIGHATIQVESSLDGCVEDHHVGHLMHRSATEREERSFVARFGR